MNNRIKVMVVDDQQLLRETLERVLALESDFVVLPGADCGKKAIELLAGQQLDVLLMDIKMREMDGITATGLIKDMLPGCRILMLTVLGEQEYVQRAIMAGADGYLLKDATRQQVVEAIRRVHLGESVVEPALLASVIDRYRDMERGVVAPNGYPCGLTKRELEVLRLLAAGKSNEEIASILYMAVGTVKSHLHRAFEKIGVRDRTQAAIFVIHQKL